jgi:hypothetical protein
MPNSPGKRFLSMILPAGASLLLVSSCLPCLGAEVRGEADTHATQPPPRELSAKERERRLAELRAGIAKAAADICFDSVCKRPRGLPAAAISEIAPFSHPLTAQLVTLSPCRVPAKAAAVNNFPCATLAFWPKNAGIQVFEYSSYVC